MNPFSAYKEYKCKDGSTKQILRDPKHIPEIFAIITADQKIAINSDLMNQGQQLGLGGSWEKNKDLAKRGSVLDKNYVLASNLFTIAYMEFITDPCNNYKRFQRKINSIFARFLSELKSVKTLSGVAQTNE